MKQIDFSYYLKTYLLFQYHDEPFIIANLGDVVNKYHKWTQLLPRVKPFYGRCYSIAH